jgi:hypothetical protein
MVRGPVIEMGTETAIETAIETAEWREGALFVKDERP